VDRGRHWFRYHHLFADFLQLVLRRTEPAHLPTLHAAAADWYAAHGRPIEAIRQAQRGEHWRRAASLLADHWFCLYNDGRAATAHELLTGFPAGVETSDPEFVSLMAADQLLQGSIEAAEGYLALATQEAASVPPDRRVRLQVRLTLLRLSLARQRSDLPAVVEQTDALMALADAPDSAQRGVGDPLRAVSLMSLGAAELWTARLEDAEGHLAEGLALARRIGQPFMEVSGLGMWAMVAGVRSFTVGAARSRQAIELARRHGWTDEPTVAVAFAVHAYAMLGQGRLEEAEQSLARAERTLRVELERPAGILLRCARGGLELTRGRNHAALRAFRAAEELSELLVVPHALGWGMRAHVVQLLVRVGETERAEQTFAELDDDGCRSGELRTSLAAMRLAQGDPRAATVALAPVLDGSAPITIPHWRVQAFLLEAIGRDALGETGASDCALERALDLAEPDGVLYPFLFHPATGLLERHSRRGTSHASLIAEILNRLAGEAPAASRSEPEPPHESLSDSEKRILRYLPTHLTAPDIAGELYLSVHTVKSHMRHLYAKLGTHQRAETVERARALGLLAPSSRQR
jgi:LuxR family maltose regulon positive regulatory protein